MKNNSLLELFLGLLFSIVILYYNNRKTKKDKKEGALAEMYFNRVNIACISAIFFIVISIIRRLL